MVTATSLVVVVAVVAKVTDGQGNCGVDGGGDGNDNYRVNGGGNGHLMLKGQQLQQLC
jgi:hypothetical protein